MDRVDVDLPRGIRLDGAWHRRAVLRPVTGRDEAFLLEHTRALWPAQRTTALLTRCLCRLGPLSAVTAEVVRALSIGDREALLLHLRRFTLGETMDCVFACPACAEKLELELQVADFLLPPYADPAEVHETSLRVGDGSWRVRFRLPNGGDQELAAPHAAAPEAAVEQVLRGCLQEICDERTGEAIADITAPVAAALGQTMAELDPQAEILLDLVCPACDTAFRTPLDIGDYFYRELQGRADDLYQDVHLLAFHYHWSEREILALSRRKRRLYLDLLAASVREGFVQ